MTAATFSKFLKAVLLSFILIFSSGTEKVFAQKNIVNDITQLNPIPVKGIIEPTSTAQIIAAVKQHEGTISIGGGRFSMGGQTATEDALQIDMRKFNQVVHFSKSDKEITVQAGMRWRELIQFIDQHDLSVKIMQTYANFTVGGSLSVNVHGRYIGQGPIILSVKEFKIVLANGDSLTASATQNQEVFYAAIGGYGGIGIITEVTLSLTDNCRVQRVDTVMKINVYAQFFAASIKQNPNVVFHNADIYPKKYNKVRAVSYVKTEQALTVKERLKPVSKNSLLNRLAIRFVAGSAFGKWIRKVVVDPINYSGTVVESRNYEATYDVAELEPKSREHSTFVLQEYFIPEDRLDAFYPKMAEILKTHKVNVMNISIRHAKQDPGSIMAWAKTNVFAFVIYYEQGTTEADKAKVKMWTQKLMDTSINEGGTYYLPYQILATPAQFAKAYPNAETFFRLKKKYDPSYKFRNKLFDAYYKN